MTKQEIRNYYLPLREALTEEKHDELSQSLCMIFFSTIDLSLIHTIHVFLPILSKKEPNTWLIIERLTKEFAKIQISIPRMSDEHTLVNYYFEGKNQIKENKWKIPEPQFGAITLTKNIDLVIVPLLAFDLKGHRVGYGKGFYDRFLNECQPGCKKVGLSFFDPVKEIEDINRLDINLNVVITPSQAFQLN